MICRAPALAPRRAKHGPNSPPQWLRYPRKHPAWTTAVALLLGLVLLLGLFDWNWAKGPVQRLVSHSTGREFHIDGNLDVDFFPLEVHAERLFLGNSSWSSQPAMALAERLDMQVRFWPLLVGQVTLPQVTVLQPYLRLERNKQGVGNWVFGSAQGNCSSECNHTRILQLQAQDGRLEFREPTLQTSIDLHFNSAKPTGDHALAPLVLSGSGTYRAAPFELSGQIDSPLALRGKTVPYQIDLLARAGATQAHVSGGLTEPLQYQNFTVNLEIRGPDLADLYDFIGVVLPPSPPYRLQGKLTRHAEQFAYEDLTGVVGDSDLSGRAALDIAGKRPELTAVLKSKVLDFDDLAGFVGGTPGTGDGETASGQQQRAAIAQRASGRFLPATPIRLERLRTMDADVQLAAARVESRKLPLESMRAHLTLVDGQMTVDPLDFGAAGGKLASVVRVDARKAPAQFAMKMRIAQIQLPKLVPRFKAMDDSIGSITGLMELQGKGDSAATVLATSNGRLSAIMGPGRMSNLVLEVAGLDIAETLAFLIGKDRQVTVRCAYADFEVVDGLATAQSVALDTTDTALLLRGDFDFRDESLDLTLIPRPKDTSPVSIRTPIAIGGTFAHPSIGPRPGPLLLRGSIVAALAAIAPPLALLGLIETGPGKDLDCGGPSDKEHPKADPPHRPVGPSHHSDAAIAKKGPAFLPTLFELQLETYCRSATLVGFETMISTRRFCWRPAELSLLATGTPSPLPTATMRCASMPLATSAAFTALARFSDKLML